MQFGERPLDDALGSVLAHSIKAGNVRFKKGHLLTAADLSAIKSVGIESVICATLDDGDMAEDAAAAAIADKLAGGGIEAARAFTGRVNLFAKSGGVLRLARQAVDRLNRIDEAITLATLPELAVVEAGQMVATVKIIPFAVRRDSVAAAADAAVAARLAVAPFVARKARLIQTVLPETAAKLLDKTLRITADRLADVGIDLVGETRCAHSAGTLAGSIRDAMAEAPDILLIAGASAITDRADVLPTAIGEAGGEIRWFGMPVDPGNLLLLARLGATPIVGMPGCARSPKLNGFDWVLQRLAAGIEVGPADIQAMGVGGLLSEIPTRPQPRRAQPAAKAVRRIAGLLLAAGQSRRMGTRNKLLIEVRGKPMVRHAIEALEGAGLDPITVVSGHQAAHVAAAIAGTKAGIVHNPDYPTGLASSLKAGLAALPEEVDGVLVALADMPLVDAAHLRRLMAAFEPDRGRSIVVPTHRGKRGNPVIWARRFFPEMARLEGDVGARHLIGLFDEAVVEIEFGDPASLIDIDTPQALAQFEAAS